VFDDWNFTLGVDYRWVDERFLEATNQPFDKVDDYWVANARAALASPDGRWEVTVYGTNIFDEEYITYINNISFFALEILGEKRTVGATLAYHFR
jgi:iron complex outermembrane receptor protein